MSHLIVLTTCPDSDSAEKLATALVEESLAACVNIVPGVRSIYRWQGKLMKDGELLLVMKCNSERFAALKQAILQRHPYELPEVIGVSITEGHEPYLAWIDSQLENKE